MHRTYDEGVYLVRMEVVEAGVGDGGNLLVTQITCIRQSLHERLIEKLKQHSLQAAGFYLQHQHVSVPGPSDEQSTPCRAQRLYNKAAQGCRWPEL